MTTRSTLVSLVIGGTIVSLPVLYMAVHGHGQPRGHVQVSLVARTLVQTITSESGDQRVWPALLVLALAGTAALWRGDRALLLIAVAWFAVPFTLETMAAVAKPPTLRLRYWMPLAAPLALLIGAGIHGIAAALAGLLARAARGLRRSLSTQRLTGALAVIGVGTAFVVAAPTTAIVRGPGGHGAMAAVQPVMSVLHRTAGHPVLLVDSRFNGYVFAGYGVAFVEDNPYAHVVATSPYAWGFQRTQAEFLRALNGHESVVFAACPRRWRESGNAAPGGHRAHLRRVPDHLDGAARRVDGHDVPAPRRRRASGPLTRARTAPPSAGSWHPAGNSWQQRVATRTESLHSWRIHSHRQVIQRTSQSRPRRSSLPARRCRRPSGPAHPRKDRHMSAVASQPAPTPFGYRDRIGYALGDLGNDFSFILASAFLMIFYTNVLDVQAAEVGTLLLIVRLADAFVDITIGRLVDRSELRSAGRFRPGSPASGSRSRLASALMYFFGAAGWTQGAKVVYILVTYALWSVLYSAINIPYGSMAAVVTADPVQRSSLSVFRTFGAFLAQLVIVFTVPLLIFTKDANGKTQMVPHAFFWVGLAAAVVSVVAYSAATR